MLALCRCGNTARWLAASLDRIGDGIAMTLQGAVVGIIQYGPELLRFIGGLARQMIGLVGDLFRIAGMTVRNVAGLDGLPQAEEQFGLAGSW